MKRTLALLSVVVALVALTSTAALAQQIVVGSETPADEVREKEMDKTRKKEEAASLDCDDVATQRGAQALFEIPPEEFNSKDRFGLDKDGDGVACEAGPGGTAEDGTKVGAKTGGDLDCMDFASQKAAQASLKDDPADPQKLDPENNGVACEIRPTAYEDAATDLAPVAKARSEADLDCADFEFREEAMMVWFRDQSDPNDLGRGQPRSKRAEGPLDIAQDPAVCQELPKLPTSTEKLRISTANSEGASLAPAALIAAWPRGGATGLLLDLSALLLVASGVLALLGARRRRRRSGSAS